MVEEGQLALTTPLFSFRGDIEKEDCDICAGGFAGLLQDKNLSDDEKREVKKAGIFDGWKQNGAAKNKYLFSVVDNANPAAGVQKAIEAGLLGDKVKETIAKARKALGADEGNPFLNPFCIEWEYFKDEPVPMKKYDACRLEKVALTPEISALISGDPPDIAKTIEPYDRALHRAFLEEHCLVKNIPWDFVFGDIKAASAEEREAAEHHTTKAETPAPEPTRRRPPPPPPAARARQAAPPPPPPPPVEEPSDADEDAGMLLCDACEKPMSETLLVCPHCKQQYDADGNMVTAPPVPIIRRRSEAKIAPTPAAPPPPRPRSAANEADESLTDDEIPF
jgi:hypothetical protein